MNLSSDSQKVQQFGLVRAGRSAWQHRCYTPSSTIVAVSSVVISKQYGRRRLPRAG